MKAPLLLFVSLLMAPSLAWPQHATGADPSPTPSVSAAAVDVSRDTLDSYAGRYRIGPGFVLSVWREGEALKVQASGQMPQVLVAESESMFRVAGSQEKVVFGFDASGAPSYLDFHSGGRHTRALRE